jgi:hypothetical protein
MSLLVEYSLSLPSAPLDCEMPTINARLFGCAPRAGTDVSRCYADMCGMFSGHRPTDDTLLGKQGVRLQRQGMYHLELGFGQVLDSRHVPM